MQFTIEQLPQAYFSENINAKKNRKQLIKNITRHNECDTTLLSKYFFSDENIELINKQLVLTVFKKSNYKISFQKKEDLLLVMRYVYIQKAKHLPFKIKEQIRQLNCYVVKELYGSMITQVEQYEGYLRDINNPITPNDLPINTKSITSTLPSISDLFHK